MHDYNTLKPAVNKKHHLLPQELTQVAFLMVCQAEPGTF